MKTRREVAGIPVCWRELVPGRLGVYEARQPDDLLADVGEEALAADRLPYFGTLWPAGDALARFVLDADLSGVRVLDLGCGVGAVGLAAARRGGRVTVLDWEARALDLVRAAAADQGLVLEAEVPADWRSAPQLGGFARILAADVLYEDRYVAALASFLGAHLAPGAEAWIADPRRIPAAAFPETLREVGLELLSHAPLPYRPRGIRVDLLRIGPRRGEA